MARAKRFISVVVHHFFYHSRPDVMASRGFAFATVGMRRHMVFGGTSSGSAFVSLVTLGSESGSNMLRFYTDDAMSLKISPIVAALHVLGKVYRAKAGARP